MLGPMQGFRRLREQLVLGPILRYLDGDEEMLAWTHATLPELRAPGVLVVTTHHCVLHVASSATPDVTTPLSQLSGFELDRRDPEIVRVRLRGEDEGVDVELSLTNRVRSRAVGRVLSSLARHQVAGPDGFNPALTSPLPPMVRSARHHARRVWITVLGALVLLVSAVFASPFVPGPGALTAVAGIAILAREYEWARDLHVWASRQVDRFLTWLRGLRVRRHGSERGRDQGGPPARRERGDVLEAEVPVPAADLQRRDPRNRAIAS